MSTKAELVPKKLLVPFILITSLFALWGFANDITNPMVAAFKRVLELSNTQASNCIACCVFRRHIFARSSS